MNSNVIGSYLSNYEKQLKNQPIKQPIDIRDYQKRLINDRRPDTLITDDTPRKNIQNRYSRLGLQEYGRNSNSGKELFLNEVSLYSNGERDPRGWAEDPLMEKIKEYSYGNAARIKSSLFKGDGLGGVQDQLSHAELLQHQDMARQHAKQFMRIFADETIGYNPTKMTDISDNDGLNLKFQTDQMQQNQQQIANRRTLHNFGMGNKTNSDLFSKTEPDHKLFVADYSQVYMNNPRLDPSNYEDIYEQFQKNKENFDSNLKQENIDLKYIISNINLKRGSKQPTTQHEKQTISHILENLVNNKKQQFDQQRIARQHLTNNDTQMKESIAGRQQKNSMSLLEQFQSLNPYQNKQQQIFDKAIQIGLDDRVLQRIQQEPQQSKKILQLVILEEFINTIVNNKNLKHLPRQMQQQINYQQQYETLINQIQEQYQKVVKQKERERDPTVLLQQTHQTRSINYQDSDYLSQNITNKAKLRQTVVELMLKNNLTFDNLQKMSESFQNQKYRGSVQGLSGSDIIQQQITQQQFLHNQDNEQRASIQTVQYNMLNPHIGHNVLTKNSNFALQTNDIRGSQVEKFEQQFGNNQTNQKAVVNNFRRHQPVKQKNNSVYETQSEDIDLLNYR